MAYDFSEFRQAGESITAWLKKEYSGIRTSRAMPNVLDSIVVLAYNSSMPISQLATISIEDPKTLRITVWDKDISRNIDSAIRESSLGLSVALDGESLRVSFPELTSERRAMFIKIAKEKLEEARIKVRNERERNHTQIDKKEKAGEISEDDKFRLRAELQKLVDKLNESLEELASKKEKEILE